jgi:hypothetical protein
MVEGKREIVGPIWVNEYVRGDGMEMGHLLFFKVREEKEGKAEEYHECEAVCLLCPDEDYFDKVVRIDEGGQVRPDRCSLFSGLFEELENHIAKEHGERGKWLGWHYMP